MFGRKREGSVLCPSCGQLVGVNDDRCLNCGRLRPGLFGFAGLLRNLGDDNAFLAVVLFGCGALFLATLAASPGHEGSLLRLAPTDYAVLRFGASGTVPVFGLGRWWTALSATWLHGNIPHIVLNMMAARTLLPLTSHLYGAARTVILYVVAGVVGFAASSIAGLLFPGVWLIGGNPGLTVGASASLFGLIGALLFYGRRSGSGMIRDAARNWALGGLVMGFVIPGIDNWAHLGGLAGGYLVGRILDPLVPERGDHVLIAGGCLLASLLAIGASLLVPLR
jgi:rhomboid protease GluP